MAKVTSKQLEILGIGIEPKKAVKKRYKKCSLCKKDMPNAIASSLFVEGEYHSDCLVEVIACTNRD